MLGADLIRTGKECAKLKKRNHFLFDIFMVQSLFFSLCFVDIFQLSLSLSLSLYLSHVYTTSGFSFSASIRYRNVYCVNIFLVQPQLSKVKVDQSKFNEIPLS